MLRVRAVVMTRDDSSGGWVPTGGGGLSHVTVTRRREDGHRHRQYLIRGERLRDQAPTLECALRRDLEYNEVTPTFHHWRVGGSRFGLTFQSPADASAFRRGVRGALQALAAGSPSSSSSSSSSSSAGDRGDTGGRSPAPEQPPPSPPGSPRTPHPEPPPVPPTIVTSESSATGYRPLGGQPQPPPPLGEAEEPPETPPPRRDPRGARGYEDYRRAGGASAAGSAGTPPARVRFQKDPKGSPSCRIHGDPPPGAPSRCVYCRGVFSREENGRGQCRDAPDPAGRCVRRLSCLWCAESLLYHCMADAEGDFSAPCSCGGGHPHCCARWLAPAALALLVPCLCCYPPLRACHWCGGHCGCCGGRHKAAR
ncbi:sprouty-related, EVH1 domain-containing protein 3 [Buteo buteo]|uniref:sprouty-related, EVH1 domain-containing protein 3 n=1 Tax=Buteo buteo TaxID=30397 RepID=UPI003EB876EC